MTLIAINAGMFLATAAAVFFMLRYRIHVHVECRAPEARSRRPRTRTAPPAAPVAASPVSAAITADIESSLINLGASKEEAKARAAQAIAQGPGDFDALILRAMQAGSEQPTRRRTQRRRPE